MRRSFSLVPSTYGKSILILISSCWISVACASCCDRGKLWLIVILLKILLIMLFWHPFCLNPIQDGLFRGCSQMPQISLFGPLPKICHTYFTMMKLGTVIPYLTETQKYINHMTYPLNSAGISIFLKRNQKILLHQEVQV